MFWSPWSQKRWRSRGRRCCTWWWTCSAFSWVSVGRYQNYTSAQFGVLVNYRIQYCCQAGDDEICVVWQCHHFPAPSRLRGPYGACVLRPWQQLAKRWSHVGNTALFTRVGITTTCVKCDHWALGTILSKPVSKKSTLSNFSSMSECGAKIAVGFVYADPNWWNMTL